MIVLVDDVTDMRHVVDVIERDRRYRQSKEEYRNWRRTWNSRIRINNKQNKQ